jgi:hypothetical protein
VETLLDLVKDQLLALGQAHLFLRWIYGSRCRAAQVPTPDEARSDEIRQL